MNDTVINKEKILKQLTSWVKDTHPERTTEFDKCYRDLNYILDAILNDINFNSAIQTQNIANKFWSRGESVLQSYFVELEVYQKLKDIIVSLYDDRQTQNQIDDLFFILSMTIKNGPSYIDGSWENICNNRIMTFAWSSEIPTKNKIDEILTELHQFVPSKQRRVRYYIDVIPNYANHDLKLKIYGGTQANVNIPSTRYNPQTLAPWLLMFSVNYNANTESRDLAYYEKESWLDIGLALQQVMLSAAAKGLNVGLCGCINNYNEIKQLIGREPVIYAGIGYRDTSDTYFCPLRNVKTKVPSRDIDQKPLLKSYIYYH